MSSVGGVELRVCLLQVEDLGSVEGNVRHAEEMLLKAKDADFACLPEFFAIPRGYDKSIYDAWRENMAAIDMLRRASERIKGYVIGGSVIEKEADRFYNTCFIFKKGELVAKYRKINLTDEEESKGLTPGKEILSLKTEYGYVTVLICADILDMDLAEKAAQGKTIVFLPISLTKPQHPKVRGHPLTEKLAKKCNTYVAKVSRIGVEGDVKFGVKSVIISPKGVVAEATSETEEEILCAEIAPQL